MYRNADLTELKRQKWATLKTGDHPFRLDVFHITPEYQIDQLKNAGLYVETVYDMGGTIVDHANSNAVCMYFLCAKGTSNTRECRFALTNWEKMPYARSGEILDLQSGSDGKAA
jgi:hypothetical protein